MSRSACEEGSRDLWSATRDRGEPGPHDDPSGAGIRTGFRDQEIRRKAERTATAAIDLAGRCGGRVRSAEPPPVADDELLRRVRSGDDHAFRELFAKYAPVANALAHRLVRQTHLAEEIVQEAFLSIWRSPERYDRSKGSVRSWLMGAVHNRAVDVIRREESQRRRAGQAATALEVVEDPVDELVAEVDRPRERALVRQALDGLPEEQRDVIAKMYFEGSTQSQIAEQTGLPLGTVKSRCLLGMRRLRGILGDLER
jgi:RNA polymerase sigma-70 factor, ECF subfamily